MNTDPAGHVAQDWESTCTHTWAVAPRASAMRGAGISVFKVDPASARLELAQVLEGLVNPPYLALNARGDRLYAPRLLRQ